MKHDIDDPAGGLGTSSSPVGSAGEDEGPPGEPVLIALLGFMVVLCGANLNEDGYTTDGRIVVVAGLLLLAYAAGLAARRRIRG